MKKNTASLNLGTPVLDGKPSLLPDSHTFEIDHLHFSKRMQEKPIGTETIYAKDHEP